MPPTGSPLMLRARSVSAGRSAVNQLRVAWWPAALRWPAGRSTEFDALEAAVVPPVGEVAEERHGALRVAAEELGAPAQRLALVVVVAGRAVGAPDDARAGPREQELQPLLLGLGRHL